MNGMTSIWRRKANKVQDIFIVCFFAFIWFGIFYGVCEGRNFAHLIIGVVASYIVFLVTKEKLIVVVLGFFLVVICALTVIF